MKNFKLKAPLEGYLACICLIILIALLTIQVFFRYVLNMSVTWAEEVSRFAFVWAVYFGFVLAAKKEKHIRVTAHINLLPEKTQKIILTIADLLWVGFNIMVVIVAVQFVYSMFEFPYYSQTTGINLAYVNIIVPIGFFFMTVRIIQSMIKRIRGKYSEIDSRMDT